MMWHEFGQAALTAAVPLAAFFLPALVLLPRITLEDLLYTGSRLMLWNIGGLVVATFIAAFLHIPMVYVGFAVLFCVVLGLWVRRRELLVLPRMWGTLGIILAISIVYVIFAVPFLTNLQGLPTGDSQKAIVWASRALALNSLPDYGISFTYLNRDAGDFFTPGLHTFTALIMRLTGQPLTAVGFISIIFGAAVAWIAAAIFSELFDDRPHRMPPLLAAVFVLTNFRFLRYLREPGYHFQNVVGEFLLFGLLLVGMRLLRRFTWGDAILGAVLTVALVLTHQFSVFVAFFALLPLAIIFLFTRRSKGVIVSIIGAGILLAVAAIPFGLYAKIPHLFTANAHLASLTPSLISYPLTLGTPWFMFGVAGLLLLLIRSIKGATAKRWAFLLATLAILALSQGPRIFLDIPPVRALFYSVVPLSITGAYFIMNLRHLFSRSYSGFPKMAAQVALFVLVALPISASTIEAYASSSTSSPANSTLVPEQVFFSNLIAADKSKGGVLIDDYNNRSASWLVLSGKPMFTRIAANISRQMEEASQSDVRKQLYLNQLEYEKIYSLASNPIIAKLFVDQNIQWVLGVVGKNADGFMYNPALREAARANNAVLYSLAKTKTDLSDQDIWLLKNTTLANDIGDNEDTFEHLPISLRTPRLSDPKVQGHTTYRTTTSPIIPIQVNVGDYISKLWDQDGDTIPDASLDLYIETLQPGESYTVRTITGATYTGESHTPLKINASDLPIGDDGFIMLYLINQQEKPINLDMIALGLAHTP